MELAVGKIWKLKVSRLAEFPIVHISYRASAR